jgi:hypothetical protein
MVKKALGFRVEGLGLTFSVLALDSNGEEGFRV